MGTQLFAISSSGYAGRNPREPAASTDPAYLPVQKLVLVEPDPPRLIGHRIAAEEYLRIRNVIASYYSVALTDCGTGVTHNAMKGMLKPETRRAYEEIAAAYQRGH